MHCAIIIVAFWIISAAVQYIAYRKTKHKQSV
jgi:cbb3-type cytochrome oxidase subunit 3